MKKILLVILVLVVILSGTSVAKYLWDLNTYHTLDLNYSESTNALQNPDRGWYIINSCMVNDHYEEGDFYYSKFQEQYKEGNTLVLLLFNISNYQNQDISKEGLLYITNVLEDVKKAGMKAIVRFVYDWDGNGAENEPDNIETILKHMEQVSSVVNAKKDSIYLLQGIFVGSYGEMHGSKYLEEENVSILMQKLLDVMDSSIILSVRTPAYWRMFNQSNDPVNSFSQLPEARIGLFNDGLCSSDIDIGTYSDGTECKNGYSDKWKRSEELEFQSKLCQFVPNGGEIAAESEYNDLNQIVEEFPKLHISYLNKGYNLDVLEKWENSEYTAQSKEDPYTGLNGYKYVEDHLGYRFVLREVAVPRTVYLKNNITIKMELENTGFSNLYKNKNVFLILEGENTGGVVSFSVETDVRTWKPKEITELRITLSTKELKVDTYKLYLKIIDDNENTIKLANDNIYNSDLKANAVGEINVQNISLKNIWSMD